jgi:hypothetical protein
MLHVILDFFITELTTNKLLEGEHGVFGVNDSLTFGR